jgi:Spy/CpxP family protein refolding chaperone
MDVPYPHHHYAPDSFSGGFGVRRPLRFLAWKLGLNETQITDLAAILNELKTERAQGAVDDRRALTLLADAAQTEAFDESKADEASRLRVASEERVQKRVQDALRRMHGLFTPEQRTQLAYLLRTGTLTM